MSHTNGANYIPDCGIPPSAKSRKFNLRSRSQRINEGDANTDCHRYIRKLLERNHTNATRHQPPVGGASPSRSKATPTGRTG